MVALPMEKSALNWILICVMYAISTLSLGTLANDKERVYNYCLDPDWMPYEGLIRGQHKGISAEYKLIFERESNLKFQLVPTDTWKQTTEYLKSGKCDLTLILNRSVQRDQYLSFTIPYFFSSNVLVTKSDFPYIQSFRSLGAAKTGVVSSYRINDYIDKYHPQINKYNVINELAGLKAVNDDELDVYVGSLLSVTAKMQELSGHDLKINGWVALQDELRIGVVKKHAATLIPIFNEIIEQIPASTHNDIFYRWSNTRIVTKPDYTLLLQAGVGLSLALLFFVWRYFDSLKVTKVLLKKNEELQTLHQELEESNNKLKFLSYHDNLTGLYNRHYFLTTFKHLFNDTKRQTRNMVLMMIDIDHFKQVNDLHGHMAGDRVLADFGKQLLHILREGDISARWGGEEFIVLLPSTSIIEGKRVALRLNKHISNHPFPDVSSITVSIGLAEFVNSDTSNSWIERADQALYQAKSTGRNKVIVASKPNPKLTLL